jgi:hypothetical protein
MLLLLIDVSVWIFLSFGFISVTCYSNWAVAFHLSLGVNVSPCNLNDSVEWQVRYY